MDLLDRKVDEIMALAKERNNVEVTSNPDAWGALAEKYEQIGALCNAAVCRDHERHYRQMLSRKDYE